MPRTLAAVPLNTKNAPAAPNAADSSLAALTVQSSAPYGPASPAFAAAIAATTSGCAPAWLSLPKLLRPGIITTGSGYRARLARPPPGDDHATPAAGTPSAGERKGSVGAGSILSTMAFAGGEFRANSSRSQNPGDRACPSRSA